MYKSQLPVIEQALETAFRMLGSNNERIIKGFQLRTSCARDSGNMGVEGDPRSP